ncbi:GntR family transcriptional regulator [Microbacterium sp. SLBN-154]|uniref:GntR family transcriptional regulator n=1 Tax=Microbacterium sp. SLBN-154 TaxID=2768458 RepID=UPI0011681BA0|nr:GntR family transcriptional regulator [Microbacterium sp. SLBN-154]TQK17637.1 GntR family transcriptional regulator [Microbacterium sp. SLBN-154]
MTPSSATTDLPVGGSLPAQIFGRLEEAIIGGEFTPGSRLRADEIAATYGVSRIPVREAFSALAESGWVEIRPRYGVYVRQRSRDELTELFEARAGIEQEIARLAAERRTDHDLEALRDAVERSRAAAPRRNASELTQAAADYNVALRAASHNAVLGTLSLQLEKRARFYFAPIAAEVGASWTEGQERLLGILERGDAEAAAASARRHILETERDVADLLDSEIFSD